MFIFEKKVNLGIEISNNYKITNIVNSHSIVSEES